MLTTLTSPPLLLKDALVGVELLDLNPSVVVFRNNPELLMCILRNLDLQEAEPKRTAPQNRLKPLSTLSTTLAIVLRCSARQSETTTAPSIVSLVTAAPPLSHTTPFLWKRELRVLECGTKQTSWILSMTFSESEYSCLRKHCEEALERLLDNEHADIADLVRSSVL